MEVVIIKYNAGNIKSVEFALERIGINATVSDDKEIIQRADKIIFPGVGEASSAMSYLRQYGLDEIIKELKQPVLGICLGMQLLCQHSEEGNTECLGIFDTQVKRFGDELKVPQIGWNKLSETSGPLFRDMQGESFCYFVHSYYAGLCADTIAVTEYGLKFSSALSKRNFYGVQFHPEKSAEAGEAILHNFLTL
ncbi:MAG TPA: imidazole glycerol phosphate synthase subunit HisH [Parasegetibacter sp.]